MATDRLNALVAELRSAYGLEIEVITADLVDHDQIEPVLKRVRAEPQIDILGNNAGAGLLGGFATADAAEMETARGVDLWFRAGNLPRSERGDVRPPGVQLPI